MNQFMLNKIVISLLCTALVALSGFVFNANSRIAVLELHALQQDGLARENQENFRKLDESIGRLNTILSILNDRLSRDGKRIVIPTSGVE